MKFTDQLCAELCDKINSRLIGDSEISPLVRGLLEHQLSDEQCNLIYNTLKNRLHSELTYYLHDRVQLPLINQLWRQLHKGLKSEL